MDHHIVSYRQLLAHFEMASKYSRGIWDVFDAKGEPTSQPNSITDMLNSWGYDIDDVAINVSIEYDCFCHEDEGDEDGEQVLGLMYIDGVRRVAIDECGGGEEELFMTTRTNP